MRRAQWAFYLATAASVIFYGALLLSMVLAFLVRDSPASSSDSNSVPGLVVLIIAGLCVLGAAVAMWPVAAHEGTPGRSSAVLTILLAGILLLGLCGWLAYWNVTDVPIGAILLFVVGLPFLPIASLATWRITRGNLKS